MQPFGFGRFRNQFQLRTALDQADRFAVRGKPVLVVRQNLVDVVQECFVGFDRSVVRLYHFDVSGKQCSRKIMQTIARRAGSDLFDRGSPVDSARSFTIGRDHVAVCLDNLFQDIHRNSLSGSFRWRWQLALRPSFWPPDR
ncbi:hypothetical protein, partial [Sphingobium sp.]|uniref:hypothetical protein n=1 Tax=Sphingobium sp. TaxID=1912891 RepID=UPI0025E934B9